MTPPLLHLIPTALWRECLAAGAIAPSVAEFVHLSTADQVALPAGRLFAGRPDLLLLAVDPDRIDVPVRFEAGLPTDPPAMRFPHAYGPIRTSAVLAVLPYRPRSDGGFDTPALPVLDAAGRQSAFEPSFLRRAATCETAVAGGVAVRTAPVPVSHRHNQLLIDGEVDAATLVNEADRALAGLDHRHATLAGPHAADTAAALARRGWEVEPLIGMAAPADVPGPGRTEVIDLDALRPAWTATWRRHLPDAPDDVVAQLVDRHLAEEPVIDVRYLALRDRGQVAASAVLRIDGATAELDAVETVPEHRRSGLGDILLADARALAAAAGCDVVTLTAAAGDWPHRWYARRGFTEVSRSWSAGRTIAT
jgi:uncharacterized protein (DUF952 family)/GNAT superfamily N-acetyltransferase